MPARRGEGRQEGQIQRGVPGRGRRVPVRELLDDRVLDLLLEQARDAAGGLRLTGEGSLLASWSRRCRARWSAGPGSSLGARKRPRRLPMVLVAEDQRALVPLLAGLGGASSSSLVMQASGSASRSSAPGSPAGRRASWARSARGWQDRAGR